MIAKEKRLIDANALMVAARNSTVSKTVKHAICILAELAPIVDAVEVVRCKDCHNCTKSMWCNLLMMDVKGEWFCCHGKRRDDG